MSVALVGLVSFQLFWINSVIKLNNERFDRDVHESLAMVVTRLENKENLYFAFRGMNKFIDSSDTLSTEHSIEVIVEPDSIKKILQINDNIRRLKMKAKFNDTINEKQIVSKALVERKSGLIEIILEEMVNPPPMIEYRISKEMIDSLLHHELAQKGIHLKYEFGVLNPITDKVVLANTKNMDQLKKTDLKATLFPNDIISNADFLMVNFPNKTSFLFRQIWATLTSSFVLLLIIIGLFAFALLTIIRQKKLSEMKNDFIDNMTHEFKTPIATVSLATQALGEPEIVRDKVLFQRYLNIIKDENERLGNQVEKVLQLATMERENLNLEIEELDLNQIIKDAAAQLALQIEQKGGQITLQFFSEPIKIKADENHLFSVLVNLIDNANKYSPENPKIDIVTRKEKEKVIIEVKDRGVGMSKENSRKVFDKFYRVPTGNVHNVKGFGLGLNYVKSIIEKHGGSIEVDSEPGEGTTFRIIL